MRSPALLGSALAGAAFAAAVLPLACSDDARPAADPTYRDDVASILDARCARCHANDAPAAGYRTSPYTGAIGCTAAGKVAVLPTDAAPMVTVLDDDTHRALLSGDERAVLEAWVRSGAQDVRGGVHPARFADPRSPSGHASALRQTRYRALTDANDRDACVRCHDGAGARPDGVTSAAPGATACTTCHAEPGGVNACSTCHGAADRSYPPRDACFFPSDPTKDAHAAHAAPSAARASGFDCAACHPKPEPGVLSGAHTDGHVEVWLDPAVAGANAHRDAITGRCTGTCHDRGGSRPDPTWTSGGAPLDCGSCHSSPPRDHFAGPCSSCHAEANANGTALATPRLHVNGKVDLGDGSGKCGACHGSGNSPWPSTGAHAAHRAPVGAAPVACSTCHVVPGPGDVHPVRAAAGAVRLAGLATNGGAPATYAPATKTCSSTYCHDGAGGAVAAPRWTDGAPSGACGSCHATPPPLPHAPNAACASSTCHEGITTGALTISAAGQAVHVNGLIDRRVP